MQGKSIKEAIAAAEKESPAGSGKAGVWEAGTPECEIVASNVNTTFESPRIGIQVQNEEGRRRWFDLYFDDSNTKSLAATGRKLRGLGMDPVVDAAETQYPDDDVAQLQMIADALKGVKFKAKIDKVESNKNAPGTKPEDMKYINYFDVLELVAGPANTPAQPTPPSGGLSGLMGG